MQTLVNDKAKLVESNKEYDDLQIKFEETELRLDQAMQLLRSNELKMNEYESKLLRCTAHEIEAAEFHASEVSKLQECNALLCTEVKKIQLEMDQKVLEFSEIQMEEQQKVNMSKLKVAELEEDALCMNIRLKDLNDLLESEQAKVLEASTVIADLRLCSDMLLRQFELKSMSVEDFQSKRNHLHVPIQSNYNSVSSPTKTVSNSF